MRAGIRTCAGAGFTIILSTLLLACSASAWHPDRDGYGLWYNARIQRMLFLEKNADEGKPGYTLRMFSTSPKENTVSLLDFSMIERDHYVCSDDDRIKIFVKGADIEFKGYYTNGKAFDEDYKAVPLSDAAKLFDSFSAQYAKLSAVEHPTLEEIVLKANLFSLMDVLSSVPRP